MFNISHICIESMKLKLKFNSEEEVQKCNLVFRLKDNEKFIIYSYTDQFKIALDCKNKVHDVTIDIKDLVENFTKLNNNTNIIMMYIEYNNKFYNPKVNMELKKYIQDIESININDIIKFTLINKKNGTLELSYTDRQLKSYLNNISINNENVVFNISTIENNTNNEINISSVMLSQRFNKHVLKYRDSICLERISQQEFQLNIKDLTNMSLEKIANYDLMVEIEQENFKVQKLVSLEKFIGKLEEYVYINKIYEGKFYKTKMETIAFKIVNLNKSIKVDKFLVDNSNIYIYAKLDEIKDVFGEYNTALEIYNVFGDEECDEEILFYRKELGKNNLNIETNINIVDIFGELSSNYIQEYKVVLSVRGTKFEYKYNLKFDSKKVEQIYDKCEYNIKLKKTILKCQFGNEFKVIVNSKQPNRVRLAVLGSCFSRSAFRSNESYYNPDYKLYFDVPFTHFWFSVLGSTSSSLKEKFDIKNFSDIEEKHIMDIKREYYKTTFDELIDSDADYIIIDFFVDALHGVRKFKDDSIIVRNFQMGKSKYYRNVIMDETDKFDYSKEEFFDKWMKSCDVLVEKLLNIVPENKIILNLGSNLTEEYYDSDNVRKSFIKEKKFKRSDLRYYNMIWSKMNRYFLNKIPNARVVDMRNTKFIGHKNHPTSCGPHHFESEFYKAFFNEVIKVVLYDKLEKSEI